MIPVAIVIPLRDDLDALAELAARIAAWPDQPEEVVVAAAAASTRLAELAADMGWRVVIAPGHRGERLDSGARATAAPILWFLHADAAPPAAGLATIAATVREGAVGGCLRFRFQGPRTATKRTLEWFVGLRVRLGGIAYGDQGLFARRDAYLAAGGFAHEPLFEEVRLVRELRKRGEFRLLEEPIGVATRRWERDGWWRRTWHNRWLALRHMCGVRAQRLARSYHDSRRTTNS